MIATISKEKKSRSYYSIVVRFKRCSDQMKRIDIETVQVLRGKEPANSSPAGERATADFHLQCDYPYLLQGDNLSQEKKNCD